MLSLLWLFLIPLISSLVVLIVPMSSSKWLKNLTFILSLIPLALLIYGNVKWIGSNVDYVWLQNLSIHFQLSVDGVSLLFLFLSAIIIPISILSVNYNNISSPKLFYALILLLECFLFGFFTARDLVVFTIFWEAMLLPLYFIISIWGGPHSHSAAIKFLIYMIAGSALMVAAVLFLYLGAGTFNLDALSKVSEKAPYVGWLFVIFLLAFAVKTPLFPFHAWLPDAYCQAPTAGTILLSAILSKAGIYGIYRIGLGFFPTLMMQWGPVLLGLAIIGVLYGGLAAWMQNDFKRLIAYSSFSHVNFILAGLFIWNETAHSGAILQALNHGVTIAALFLVAGWLEDRLGNTSINFNTGLCKYMPHLCWLTLFFVLSSVALPGTNNFIGEIMILFGLFAFNPWLAAVLALTVILSVIYMLRWMQQVYFETPSPYKQSWMDIKGKELAISLPLIFLVLWIGIYPSPVLKQIEPINKNVAIAKLEVSE